MLKHIPNTLTILRFFLIPLILLFLFNDNFILVILFIILSGITDILDGTIARKFNIVTNFGKLIDPLADKFTQLSILGTLVLKSIIPLWILIIVLFKELAMVVGATFLYKKDLVVSSKWYGKTSTTLLYLAIVLSMIFKTLQLETSLDLILYYIALIMTIFSLVMYFIEFYAKEYLKKNSLKLNRNIIKEEL